MNFIDNNPGRSDWDRYVTGCRYGSFTHLYGWGKCLAEGYDLPVFRIAVRKNNQDGKITGVLPLILLDVPDGPRRLISLPYSDAAGILADDQGSSAALAAAALELAASEKVDHLEYRQAAASESYLGTVLAGDSGCKAHSFKVELSRDLSGSGEDLWKDLPGKVRNQVRKARKNNCRAAIGGKNLLDDFYIVFAENMRDLGSPVHSRELFSEVLSELGNACRVIIVYADGSPAAAAMVFRCRDTLYNPWASSLRRYRPICPNMLLYWTMLRYGGKVGCSRFDFGRSSPQATTCRFKMQWGANAAPLIWYVISGSSSMWNPQSEYLEFEWVKQLPLDESLRIGPNLRRWISL